MPKNAVLPMSCAFQTILELTEANLVTYSLPLGHAKKLLRAIDALRAEIGEQREHLLSDNARQ